MAGNADPSTVSGLFCGAQSACCRADGRQGISSPQADDRGKVHLSSIKMETPIRSLSKLAPSLLRSIKKGIIYRAVPASHEAIGQRITLADQVLESHQGNCIELTLLMASVLEAVGINSGVVIMRGHAFLGVWLSEVCYRQSICDDASS